MSRLGCPTLVGIGLVVLLTGAISALTRSGSDKATAAYLDSSDGKDWPGYGRTFGEQHFSPLDEVNPSTVARLGLVWSMDLGPEHSVSQPIAVDGTLYFTTGQSIIHAVDAATGGLLWQYAAGSPEKAGRGLRQALGTRGIAWWNGKIYTGTVDGRLVALDAKTGAVRWSVQTFARKNPALISGAPRVFDGKVVIGFGGDAGPNRGYVTAYDAETGRQLWRFFTVPGDPAKGFENAAMEMAAKTWAGEWWKAGGGGNVWNAMAYDPDTGLLYIGVANGYPWNRRVRSQDKGDNLFLCSIVAIEGATSKYRWHYQLSPGDSWDMGGTEDIELADLVIAGRLRKVLMQAPKNGFFYVIDRVTGELISAEPFAKATWASRIDRETGRPVENVDVRYPNGSTAEIWPSGDGAHHWLPMAYSPKAALAFIPVIEKGMLYSDKGISLNDWHPPSNGPVDVGVNIAPGPNDGGSLTAWDPVAQTARWQVKQPTAAIGGVLATGGDLVFQGSIDSTFKAYSAGTGKVLWSFAAETPIIAPAISYSAGGRQLITVLTGLSTSSPGFLSKAEKERYRVSPALQRRRVLTFALDGKAPLPVDHASGSDIPDDPDFRPDAATATAGERIFGENLCALCHGEEAVAGGNAPDLRRSTVPISADAFAKVVRDGALAAQGMPPFREFTDEQLSELRQYIRTEAHMMRIKERKKAL